MLKKIVIAGSAAAIVLGAGTAALAASGSSSSSTAPSSSSSSAPAKTHNGNGHSGNGRGSQLRRALHATWVTPAAKGSTTYVTHDEIRGQVTAASATSITVKAADNVSETYAVNGSTKIHTRAAGKGVAGTIGQVHKGDKVMVLGTGTSTLTATQIVDATK